MLQSHRGGNAKTITLGCYNVHHPSAVINDHTILDHIHQNLDHPSFSIHDQTDSMHISPFKGYNRPHRQQLRPKYTECAK